MSRYGITTADLKRQALNLQIGQGIADRMASIDATSFINEAETWAEYEVSDRLGVPLKPVPAPGESTVPTTATKGNFPFEFVQAVIYQALSNLMMSEFFQNEPTKSESAMNFGILAREFLERFKNRPTTPVGAGRRRHVNPFMPPNVAPPPKEDFRPRNPWGS